MIGFILGIKKNQQQSFNESGERFPMTSITVDNCYLVGIKRPTINGYLAFKLGLGRAKNLKKPIVKDLLKAGIKTPLRFLKEIRFKTGKEKLNFIKEGKREGIQMGTIKLFVGDKIDPRLLFQKGDRVIISGRSKAKGFQGVVKRHHFRGGPKTHGQSDRERAPGSIGNRTTPGRVYKGKRMAGRMGGERVSLKRVLVVEVTDRLLQVKGLVPGWQGGFLEIKKDYLN